MQSLNERLFLLLNASAAPPMFVVDIARALAQGAICVVPIALLFGWLRGSRQIREALLAATAAGLLALAVNQLIGLAWYRPRPFELGLGHQWMAHARDSSFPSDHVTLIWSVALMLLAPRATRIPGAALALLGLPVAWARIYLGVHFPLDMAGALLVALASAGILLPASGTLVPLLLRALMPAHRRIFAPFIAKGWVTE
jgi:undecaprenyl-diphosphatase